MFDRDYWSKRSKTIAKLTGLQEEKDAEAGLYINGNQISKLLSDYKLKVGTTLVVVKVEKWLGADNKMKFLVELVDEELVDDRL